MKSRRSLILSIGLVAIAAPRLAFAETASELMKKGKDLVEQNQVDQGCALIFKAESLEPSVDTIGLVAACHEKQGKLASAYREYLTTADRAAKVNDDRQKFAIDQASKLEPRVPRITVRSAAGESIKITIGGEDYSAPKMVDPGTVTVVATEPHGRRWTKDVRVETASIPVDVPPIASWQSQPFRDGSGGGERHYASGPPPAAIIAGVIGIAGLGVMGGAGIATIVLNNDANATDKQQGGACKAGSTAGDCPRAASQHNQAVTASYVADAGLAVGVVGVALAAVFWGAHVGAKSSDEKQALTVPMDVVPVAGGGAVVWRGAF